MRLSLRVRVLLGLVLLNGVLFAGGLWFLSREAASAREEYAGQTIDALLHTFAPDITPQSELSVGPILSWSLWQSFADALVMRDSYEIDAAGRVQARGALVNPRGRFGRSALADPQPRLREIVRSIEKRHPTIGAGGIAVPMRDASGEIWGGLWVPLRGVEPGNLLLALLPWFLLSLSLLTLGAFFVLRRSVLDPLEELAGAARRVKSGDLAARVPERGRADEIGQLVHSFNEMTAEVQGFSARLSAEVERATEQARRAEAAALTQRRLAAMGELAAGIAHEINNPLGGMLNAVEALEGGKLPPERHKRYFELVHSGLERIRTTVGKLLRFTPRSASPALFAPAAAVEDAIELVQHRAAKQAVEIVRSCGVARARPEEVQARWRALPAVLGEQAELAQAVLNLLVNALDALEDARGTGGRIEIELEPRADELRLVVRDDGPGVPPEILPRLADLFFTTKEPGRGTGLGLSIVHNVIAAQGGRVFLSNLESGGFQVEILLPFGETRGA